MQNNNDPDLFVKSLSFNDGTVLSLNSSDIIIFTGPNNSGKSRAIKDIYDYYRNNREPQIVVKDIQLDYSGSLTIDYVRRFYIWNGNAFYYENHGIYDLQQVVEEWDRHQLRLSGKFFVDYLTTEERLQAASSTESINPLKQYPSKPLQSLIRHDSIERRLSELFEIAFGERLCLDRGLGSQIALVIGTDVTPREGEDRVSESFLSRLSEMPTVDIQGDGIRSFVGILLHLLSSDKSVTLIDEPEAFLHPTQARLLGEMIAKENKKQLFITTHSEDLLKGLIDNGGERVKIIRITREGAINPIARLDNAQIRTIWKDPILKFSSLLSGLFHKKVIICEADTDCRFYQAIMNAIAEDMTIVRPDVLFTYSGGKERLKVMAGALVPLKVPVAIVVDIDILDDLEKFKSLTDSISIPWDDIQNDWKMVYEYVKSQRPQLETAEVKKEVNRLLTPVTETLLPKQTADSIRRVLKQSSAWGKVKDAGKHYFRSESYNAFRRLDNQCRNYGLFIVPVGQLESFYPAISSHGTQWVNSVLENNDLKKDKDLAEAREFVKDLVGLNS